MHRPAWLRWEPCVDDVPQLTPQELLRDRHGEAVAIQARHGDLARARPTGSVGPGIEQIGRWETVDTVGWKAPNRRSVWSVTRSL